MDMKKLLLTTSAIATLGMSSLSFAGGDVPVPPARGGFYVGFGVSRDDAYIDSDFKCTNFNRIYSGSVRSCWDGGAQGWDGHIFVGYDMDVWNQFYIAGEFGYQLRDLHSRADFNKEFYGCYSGFKSSYTRFQINHTLSLAAMPGFRINPETSVFVRLAWVYSRLEGAVGAKTSMPYGPCFSTGCSDDNWEGGFQAGIGFESQLSSHMSLREGYYWSKYSSEGVHASAHFPQQPTLFSNGNKYQFCYEPQIEEFDLSLVYHFDPQGDYHWTPAAAGDAVYGGIAGSRDTGFVETRQHIKRYGFLNGLALHKGNELTSQRFNDIDFKARGWDFDVFLGWGHTLASGGYLGAEVFYDHSNMDYDWHSSRDGSLLIFSGNRTDCTHFELEHSYGIAFLPGYRANQDTLFYARLGYVRGEFKHSEHGLFNRCCEEEETGYQLGVGMEVNIWQNLALRSEYTWTTYNRFYFGSTSVTRHIINPDMVKLPTSRRVRTFSVQPTVEQYKLGLVYRFDVGNIL